MRLHIIEHRGHCTFSSSLPAEQALATACQTGPLLMNCAKQAGSNDNDTHPLSVCWDPTCVA